MAEEVRRPDNPRGLAVARSLAQWELGDPDWADLILGAYFNPEAANTRLVREQQAEDDHG